MASKYWGDLSHKVLHDCRKTSAEEAAKPNEAKEDSKDGIGSRSGGQQDSGLQMSAA